MILATCKQSDTLIKVQQEAVLKRIDPSFLQDVWQGLGGEKKALASKYFYDERGSQYFDDICGLAEYYPYRAELRLLPSVAKELSVLMRKDLTVVEFGAGSLIKICPLLQMMPQIKRFVPIDVSAEHLYTASQKLKHQFSGLSVKPHVGDIRQPMQLPECSNDKLGFFPGSTIGNFHRDEAIAFLKNVRQTLGAKAQLLIGVDTKKSPAVLHKAYNDDRGITAAFNLNLLRRLNNELDADINLKNFEHYAFYNAGLGRIEMHLVSTCEQQFTVSGREFTMRGGESIHTECSYKYTPLEFIALAEEAGWQCRRQWMADADMFSLFLLTTGK